MQMERFLKTFLASFLTSDREETDIIGELAPITWASCLGHLLSSLLRPACLHSLVLSGLLATLSQRLSGAGETPVGQT